MKTSSYSIFDFLEACGGNWRNAVYVSCEYCYHPCKAECRGCLLTADIKGRPMAISLTQFEAITGWKVEPSDCIGRLSRYAFDELFRYYRIWECDDLSTCLLSHLDGAISAAPRPKQEKVASSGDQETDIPVAIFGIMRDKQPRPGGTPRHMKKPSDSN